MIVTLYPTSPRGKIRAIPSKSHVHRLLIAAALYGDGKSEIISDRTNDDISATVRCLTSLGAKISKLSDRFEVTPITEKGEKAVLDCGESGSTLRFLLPVAAALGTETQFIPHGKLGKRPMGPICELLNSRGVSVRQNENLSYSVSGKLCDRELEIDSSLSSQFVTGLLFSLPMLGGGTIKLLGQITSAPYIELTLSVLKEFGIDAHMDGNLISVSKKSSPTKKIYKAEGDWSNAAAILSLGAISDEGITVEGLTMNSTQGDKRIVSILSSFGAECKVNSDSVTVKKGSLSGIHYDATDTPDIVPYIAAVASVARGETYITGCERLKIKESDRLESITVTLQRLGADIEHDGRSVIKIRGKDKLSGGTADSYGDHRIVMEAAIASAMCENAVTIVGAEAIPKSYPTFFDDMASLTHANLRSGDKL